MQNRKTYGYTVWIHNKDMNVLIGGLRMHVQTSVLRS